MKFILRLGLALLTGFVSVSTASAQAYGTADTKAACPKICSTGI